MTSEWVFAPLIGRENVLEFIENKLITIRKAVQVGYYSCYAELVVVEGVPDEVFVSLNYRIRNTLDTVLIRVITDQDRVLIRSIQFLEWPQERVFAYQID